MSDNGVFQAGGLVPPANPPLALSLDLDDTLWPIAPALQLAEEAVLAWFGQYCPRVVQRYDAAGLRQLRDIIAEENPHLNHDLGALRRLCLQTALLECGYSGQQLDEAWRVYYAARMQVTPYDDAHVLLAHVPGRLPLAAVTNGNADLAMMGWGQHFDVFIRAHEVAIRKPDARIWSILLQRLGLAANRVLHIGDHPLEDVEGARNAGLQAIWLNRDGKPWPLSTPIPPVIRDLREIFPYLGLASASA